MLAAVSRRSALVEPGETLARAFAPTIETTSSGSATAVSASA